MRTLENFFKNGLTNSLTNRVFKMVYGKLYEETPAVGGPRKSFHELATAPHANERVRGEMLHLMPEEGKGIFGKPYVDQSPNQPTSRMLGRLGPFDGVRAALLAERSWPVAGALINETSTRKWLYDGGVDVVVDRKYQETIWKLVQTDAEFQIFVEECLKPLHQIRQSDMEDLPNIGSMDCATFGRYVRGLRPYREDGGPIKLAMRMVRGYMIEAKYVWFDSELRWHYLDGGLRPLKWEQDNRMNVALLEDAVLHAAEKGLLNQPMRPDLSWPHPMA